MNPDRHWPNLFKLKPSTSDKQWRQTTTSNEGSSSMEEEREREREREMEREREREKERNPDKKPRWNPKPEQIRILESIFNSGMVNPPSEEIQKIRMQLQEYGEVGDANVFYWFQNRKSRNKQKQRIRQGEKSSKPSSTHEQSCFDQYGPGVSIPNNNSSSFIGELSSSLLPPPASFPMQYSGYQQTGGINNTGHYINMGVAQMWNESTCTGNINGMCSVPQSQQIFSSFAQIYPPFMENLAAVETFEPHENFPSPSTNDNTLIHSGTESGVGSSNACLVTVFLNDIPVDVPMCRIGVKIFFGQNAALYHSCGQPVPLDEMGFTLQALQQGAMYYLVYE